MPRSRVYNHAGHYTAEGDFTPVNLQTVEGVWWMMRGARFQYLFFASGYIPLAEIWTTIVWLWENTFGVGLIVGLAGAAVLWRQQRGLFVAWFTLFIPYTYFFTAYGATDRLTMQGPTYLLWTRATGLWAALVYGTGLVVRALCGPSGAAFVVPGCELLAGKFEHGHRHLRAYGNADHGSTSQCPRVWGMVGNCAA